MPTLAKQHRPGTKPSTGETMSYEDFLETRFNHNHYEWVDGEVIEMAAVEDDHADLSDWLSTLLSMWIEAKNGGKVREDPFQMRLPVDNPISK